MNQKDMCCFLNLLLKWLWSNTLSLMSFTFLNCLLQLYMRQSYMHYRRTCLKGLLQSFKGSIRAKCYPKTLSLIHGLGYWVRLFFFLTWIMLLSLLNTHLFLYFNKRWDLIYQYRIFCMKIGVLIQNHPHCSH